jgi:hypothetical protein
MSQGQITGHGRREGQRSDGSRKRERALTFVPPVGFLHMVWKGENLGAMPRDYYGQRQSSSASVKPDPKGHTMKHKTVLWLRASN